MEHPGSLLGGNQQSVVLHGHDGTIGPSPKDAPRRTIVKKDGYTLSGFDQGDAVAGWPNAQLQAPCRLVRTGEQAHNWGGLTPIHAVSFVFLSILNSRLIERGEHPIEVERFRPNVDPASAVEQRLRIFYRR